MPRNKQQTVSLFFLNILLVECSYLKRFLFFLPLEKCKLILLICCKKIQFKSKSLMRKKKKEKPIFVCCRNTKETLKLFNHKLRNLFMEMFVCQIELYEAIKLFYMNVYTYGIPKKYRKHVKIQFVSKLKYPTTERKKKAFNSKSMFFCSFYHHQCSLFSKKDNSNIYIYWQLFRSLTMETLHVNQHHKNKKQKYNNNVWKWKGSAF